MEERAELVTSLRQLAHWATKTAGLLEQTTLIPDVNFVQVLESIPDAYQLDLTQLEDHGMGWPPTKESSQVSFLNTVTQLAAVPDQRIFEYHCGDSVPVAAYITHQVDLYCDRYVFPKKQKDNIRIVNMEMPDTYDIILVHESLEFSVDPISILSVLKRKLNKNGKIYIRFRPWSSQNGGFQHNYYSYAHAHLALDLEHNSEVNFKVIRPLATYETILSGAGLSTVFREINSIKPEEYVTFNKTIMEAIIARTWQTIRTDDALKILATDSVDYTVIA